MEKQESTTIDTISDETDNIVKEDIFEVEEIEIEEMAIDGICGVY